MTITAAKHRRVRSPDDAPTSPMLKFLIGVTAGACATLLPRLVPELSSPDPRMEFLTWQYGIACGAFSVLIGLGTLFWEWNVPKKPAQTFMTALGLPALIAGTLNVKSAGDQLHQQLQQTRDLQEALSKEAGIPTVGSGEQHSMSPRFVSPHLLAAILTARPAHAATIEALGTAAPPRSDLVLAQLGIKVQQPEFVVGLDRAADADDARRKAQELRRTLPDAKAARVGNEFVVINGDRPLTKSDALLDAVRLKNEHHLSPSLVERKELQLLE